LRLTLDSRESIESNLLNDPGLKSRRFNPTGCRGAFEKPNVRTPGYVSELAEGIRIRLRSLGEVLVRAE
jgi:hypothetical protein